MMGSREVGEYLTHTTVGNPMGGIERNDDEWGAVDESGCRLYC